MDFLNDRQQSYWRPEENERGSTTVLSQPTSGLDLVTPDRMARPRLWTFSHVEQEELG